jgi:DNA-binding transcriptional MocR family regulator
VSGGRAYGHGFSIVPDPVLYAEISTNAFKLWVIFQRHSDPEGRCYPGLKRLAHIMGCSIDTVARAKKELVEAELIECRERHDEHGRRTTDDIYLGGALVRGAPRKSAGYVPRKDAGTNKEAVELEPEERNPPDPPADRKRRPTDTSPIPAGPRIPDWVPEPTATAEDRSRAAQRLREIRQQYDPADCQEFGCHDTEAEA